MPVEPERSDDAESEGLASWDRMYHAMLGRMTLGLSPASLSLAYADWAAHLGLSPGKQLLLAQKAMRKSLRFSAYAATCLTQDADGRCIEPLPQDRRFASPGWLGWPFNVIHQGFLLTQQFWHNATTGVRGVSRHHEDVVTFASRQLLDMAAPSNFIATNPDLLETTRREGGQNLVRGWQYFLEDWERAIAGKPPVGSERVQVGRDVAVTPGKVIFRNRLIELIQYAPATDQVFADPVLIVPAWIMKYYILDLSPHNSLVRYLVERGHTVFIISWRNPTAQDRELGLDDYRQSGIEAALGAVAQVCPDRKVNAVGYCLGGTLLAIAAAQMARDGDDRLKSATLLAAQTDFEEPGELSLFIDRGALTFLEDIMWDQGFLDTHQMAGAFQLLRSNDLVWSRVISSYLAGRREEMNDLMAWNADATRMPYRMHSEYLERLFLDNELAEGRFQVAGRPVALTDIRVPVFLVGTERDHVAPWRSVHRLILFADTDITFLLTSGGHNAGIVSEPGHARRHYRIAHQASESAYVDPDSWLERARLENGSWWPEWADWLEARAGQTVAPPAMGLPKAQSDQLTDAPGRYVLQR